MCVSDDIKIGVIILVFISQTEFDNILALESNYLSLNILI